MKRVKLIKDYEEDINDILKYADVYIEENGKKIPYQEYFKLTKDANAEQLVNRSLSTDPVREKKSKEISITYKGLNNRGDMLFETFTPSSGKTWYQTIKLARLDEYVKEFKDDKDITDRELVDAIMSDDLLVFCNDPSFLYMGWKYMATKNKYGFVPESRPPKRNNPSEKGSVCKHLLLALKLLKYLKNKVVHDLREQFFRKIGHTEKTGKLERNINYTKFVNKNAVGKKDSIKALDSIKRYKRRIKI